MTRWAISLIPSTVFVAALSTGACGSSDANQPIGCTDTPVRVTAPNSLASASYVRACEGATMFVTWSDREAGAACTDARQCKPTCCLCAGGDHSALTSWCDHGHCADSSAVCCAVAGTTLQSCG